MHTLRDFILLNIFYGFRELGHFWCLQISSSSLSVWKFSIYYYQHKISCLAIRIKQMIIHSNLPQMTNQTLPTCLQGDYRDGLGEFSNASYGVFGAERVRHSTRGSCTWHEVKLKSVPAFTRRIAVAVNTIASGPADCTVTERPFPARYANSGSVCAARVVAELVVTWWTARGTAVAVEILVTHHAVRKRHVGHTADVCHVFPLSVRHQASALHPHLLDQFRTVSWN